MQSEIALESSLSLILVPPSSENFLKNFVTTWPPLNETVVEGRLMLGEKRSIASFLLYKKNEVPKSIFKIIYQS